MVNCLSFHNCFDVTRHVISKRKKKKLKVSIFFGIISLISVCFVSSIIFGFGGEIQKLPAAYPHLNPFCFDNKPPLLSACTYYGYICLTWEALSSNYRLISSGGEFFCRAFL